MGVAETFSTYTAESGARFLGLVLNDQSPVALQYLAISKIAPQPFVFYGDELYLSFQRQSDPV